VLPLDHRGNLALPFFHLRSEGFWELLPKSGTGEALNSSSQIRSLSQLRETVVGARLEEPLYRMLNDREARDLLRSVLLESYFASDARDALAEQGAVNREAFLYSERLLAQSREQTLRETLEESYRPAARDQGFRRAVVTAYAHRCALCGIRVRTLDGHTAVAAAHIVPWSASGDDRPANGLALCRTCHWAFDEGLLGISGVYEIIASVQLPDADNLPGYLDGLGGNTMSLPTDEVYWPDPGALGWHRKQVFKGPRRV